MDRVGDFYISNRYHTSLIQREMCDTGYQWCPLLIGNVIRIEHTEMTSAFILWVDAWTGDQKLKLCLQKQSYNT